MVFGSENCDIRVGIISDKHGTGLASIDEGEHDPLGVPNHVAVGQDEAVRCKYESRPGALSSAPVASNRSAGVDLDDRTADSIDGACDCTGVGVKEIIFRWKLSGGFF
jgi:hypothetical protein